MNEPRALTKKGKRKLFSCVTWIFLLVALIVVGVLMGMGIIDVPNPISWFTDQPAPTEVVVVPSVEAFQPEPSPTAITPPTVPPPTEMPEEEPAPVEEVAEEPDPVEEPAPVEEVSWPVLTCDGSLPVIRMGFDAFSYYYTAIQIKQEGYDVANGYCLELVPFWLSDVYPEYPAEVYNLDEDSRSFQVGSGQVDIMATTLDKLALNPGIGKLTGLIGETDFDDMFICNSSVGNLNDLLYKRIGAPRGAISEFFALFFFPLVGIDPVTQVEMVLYENADDTAEAYQNDLVDCIAVWFPVSELAIDAGGHVIMDSSELRIVVDVLISSNQSIQNKYSAMSAFHNSWFQALDSQFCNPGAAEQSIIDFGLNDWTEIWAPTDLTIWWETTPQADIYDNIDAMGGDRSEAGQRLHDAQVVWRTGGKQVASLSPLEFANLVYPDFVFAAESAGIGSSCDPINDTFQFNSKVDLPALTQAQVEAEGSIFAELPYESIPFEPNSTILKPEAKEILRDQILPFMRSSTGTYLLLEGSSAWPPDTKNFSYTAEQIYLGNEGDGVGSFAWQRADAVKRFMLDPDGDPNTDDGIDEDRIILGTVPPEYPKINDNSLLSLDRTVDFSVFKYGW
jgi:hypothetical protein